MPGPRCGGAEDSAAARSRASSRPITVFEDGRVDGEEVRDEIEELGAGVDFGRADSIAARLQVPARGRGHTESSGAGQKAEAAKYTPKDRSKRKREREQKRQWREPARAKNRHCSNCIGAAHLWWPRLWPGMYAHAEAPFHKEMIRNLRSRVPGAMVMRAIPLSNCPEPLHRRGGRRTRINVASPTRPARTKSR